MIFSTVYGLFAFFFMSNRIVSQCEHICTLVDIAKIICTSIKYISVFRIHFYNHITICTLWTFKNVMFMHFTLTIESMESTLASEKPNQKPMCKVPIEKLQKIAPKVKDKDFEDFVLKACEHYYKYLQRQRSRDRDAR